jgi:hypothetical protein
VNVGDFYLQLDDFGLFHSFITKAIIGGFFNGLSQYVYFRQPLGYSSGGFMDSNKSNLSGVEGYSPHHSTCVQDEESTDAVLMQMQHPKNHHRSTQEHLAD